MDAHDIGKKAQEWLADEGYTIEVSRKPGYSSFFTAFRPEKPGYAVTLGQRADSDSLTLSAGVTLGAPEASRVKGTTKQARAELLRDLTNLLYGRSSIFGIDEEDGTIKGVTVSSSIYSDGFTKDRLMSEMRTILSTQMLVIHQLGDFFGGLPASTAAPPPVSAAPAPTPKFCPSCGKPWTPGMKFCKFCGQPF